MRKYLLCLSCILMCVFYSKGETKLYAYDCSVSCPGGKKVGDLQWIPGTNGCTYNNGGWCDENYDDDNDSDNEGTCPNTCGPIIWSVGRCDKKTSTSYPYTITCERNPQATNVACCGPIVPAACQGGCGNATCSIGNCVNNKCINVNCPDDPDCICDSVPPTPSCTVAITGDSTVVSGTDNSYTVTITGDGSPKTLTLSAPSLTPNLMIV